MTSSESEEHTTSRKRSRNSTSNDAGNKKARGRPRVDTQDATAADRRRTQIRLAQRAYRQRKETTISSLKQQNAQLQSIIEQMNKSFLRFNDSALKSGLLQLNPNLAHELKHVTEQFVTLAKSATESSQDADEDVEETVLDQTTLYHNAATVSRASRDEPQHTDIGWGYTATLEASPLSTNNHSAENDILSATSFFPPIQNSAFEIARQQSLIRTNHRPMTVGQVLDQSRPPSSNEADRGSNNQSSLPFGLMDILLRGQQNSYPSDGPQIFSANISTPEVSPPTTRRSTPPFFPSVSTKSLAPAWTYSHDETTFARRLTRASLEAGFHLLSSAKLRPAALNYVFKLSLPYMTLDELRERFKMLLARGTDESLDFVGTPFIHLGGAGTHYPRKDVDGNIIPIPNAWQVRSIGPPPLKMIRAENVEDPSQSHDLNIDLGGFEGEWFDAHDVEGYLEAEKGCHINPKDSFAEVLVDVEENNMDATTPGSMVFSRDLNLNLDFSDIRASHSERSPGLSHTSSSTDSTSSQSTPPTNVPEPSFAQASGSFGLDMSGSAYNDFKFNSTEAFDQPLGLDLAPGFNNMGMNNFAAFDADGFGDISNLGLDLMGTDMAAMPIVKQRPKKAALVDVSKLIDEIIKHGVCLGRAPGFRRKDVDIAFKASLIHAY